MSDQKRRYLSPDGSLRVRRVGLPRDLGADLYHSLLAMRWWQLMICSALTFTGLALAFAALYMLGGDVITGATPGYFPDAFFFSVQTLATIGYGGMRPTGHYANCLVCIEAYSGLMCFAILAGLIFAKFSRPTARVMFSQNMVVCTINRRPALMCRMANARGNHLVEAECVVTMVRSEVTQEGERVRRLYRLPLSVPGTPVFSLTFTAIHYLDGDSPLADATPEMLLDQVVEFIVTLVGLDDVLSQTVHARHAYYWGDVKWQARFADTISQGEDGTPIMDLRHFHEVVPQASR